MELDKHIVNALFERLPKFELSYETTHHKKDSHHYDICMAVPFGKKMICWFTYRGAEDVALFFDLNRDKKLGHCTEIQHNNLNLSLGTIVYGTMINDATHERHGVFNSLVVVALRRRTFLGGAVSPAAGS